MYSIRNSYFANIFAGSIPTVFIPLAKNTLEINRHYFQCQQLENYDLSSPF